MSQITSSLEETCGFLIKETELRFWIEKFVNERTAHLDLVLEKAKDAIDDYLIESFIKSEITVYQKDILKTKGYVVLRFQIRSECRQVSVNPVGFATASPGLSGASLFTGR